MNWRQLDEDVEENSRVLREVVSARIPVLGRLPEGLLVLDQLGL